MAHIFIGTVAATLLMAGLVLLGGTVRAWVDGHVIAQRLREQIAPGAAAPWLRDRAQALLERIGRIAAGRTAIRDLQAQLLRAGFFHPAAPHVFLALRLMTALAMFAALLLQPLIHHGHLKPQNAAAAFFLGFVVYRAFSMAINRRIETRGREIRRELPYVLDLLLMVLDSGVSIDQALQHVAGQIAKAAPICAGLLARYIADTEDGMPYDMALDRLSQRLVISEGRDFAGLLKQNLFQGGELSQPLQRLAADIGDARLAHAREQMGRKSVLLTLVMLAFFMPVLLVALAGPAVSALVGTLDNVAQHLNDTRMKR